MLLAQVIQFAGDAGGLFGADVDAQRLFGVADRGFEAGNFFFDELEAVLHLLQLDGIHAAGRLFRSGLGSVAVRSRQNGRSGSFCRGCCGGERSAAPPSLRQR